MVKKALVLGTGLVSRPCLETLLKYGFTTTCVSAIQEELDNLLKAFPTLDAARLDVSRDKESVQKLIKENDIVISLLPSFLHYEIALICIEERKDLVTTSYFDEATRNLHLKAVTAGVTVLGESGLDPGIDHMLATKCVDALKEIGGQVIELRSVCGGLPAEESKAGCMKYKFSWFPKGVFISALQPAKCFLDGKTVEFKAVYETPENVTGSLEHYNLECLPNRDALKYRDLYSIQTASTLFRGTLRYQGFSKIVRSLFTLGLMEQSALPQLASSAPDLTWKDFLTILLELPTHSIEEDVEKAILGKLNGDREQMKIITELQLISDKAVPRKSTPLDALSAHLAELLVYGPGEQDLVLMCIKVSAKLPSGQLRSYEVFMAEKGTPVGGQSAMSRTVGITAAACAQVLATGEVKRKGVILPITKDIYEPVLAKLCEEGIAIKTNVIDS
ncbi:hypothetical protein RRG08_017032 [Elysia crispata]|uniref:Saccharopine dehydrogenase n=1 Tax=Elysia crispata TaxID=231223 RepID=A0AAE1CPL3_9GAST|nr:hypothetical protein RRG08_017032 [Elysia crispata]